MSSPQPWLSLYNDFAPGNGGAWSAITGNPTEVAYFDALGFGTSDANFTTTGTTFNLSRTPTSGNTLKAYFGDNTLGLGLTGGLFVNQTNDGLNGVTIIDATSFGGSQNQSFYGFFNPAANPRANMTAQYDAGTDEANLDWEATNSTDVGSRMELNSRSTGTSAGFAVYGANNSGTNSIFAVRKANSNRAFYVDNDGKVQINNAWYLPNVDGTNGQVLLTNGAGQSYWGTISTTASLTNKYIGVGDGSNQLTGYSGFQYNNTSYLFTQTIQNNVNGGTALGSPLTFGTPTHSGGGLDDLTLNWSVSNYQSNKYGGNLTIQIDSTGSPDTFSYFYTGGYSQTIGSGTGIAITGSAQTLTDTNGNVIAEITFGNTTGHTLGETWSAGTSLAAYDWGMVLTDTDGHAFIEARPVYGTYVFGDDNVPNALNGNGTQIKILDSFAEIDLYAKRYLRIEAPGGNTIVLADMQNTLWSQYGSFEVRDLLDNRFLSIDTANGVSRIGDIDNVDSETYSEVNSTNSTIMDYVDSANRRIVAPAKTLSNNTTTSIFEVALPAGAMTGGTFTVTIIATDGTDVQAHSDIVTYAAVNKAGVYTTDIQSDTANDSVATSSGTLTVTWSITTSTDKVIIRVNANSSLTTTDMKVYFQLDNNDGHVVTLL